MAHNDQGQEPAVTGPAPENWPERPGAWPAGWYPDPWFTGQLRYWNGQAWTADVRADGPAGGPMGGAAALAWGTPDPGPEDPSDAGAPVLAPSTGSTSGWSQPAAAPPPWSSEPGAPTEPAPVSGSGHGRGGLWALVVVGLVVVALVSAAVAAVITRSTETASRPSSAAPVQPVPLNPGTGSGAQADPDQSVLQKLVVGQSDVPSTETVQLITGGDQVTGQPTLDLCNATFPSESLRTARLQVAVADDQGNTVLSTEAVLYRNTAATTQAFAELRTAAAKCPATIVQSPVGEDPVKTTFNATPDGSWPQVATVDRLAYDFVTTDQLGDARHSIAVYLRRGRALIGVYFANPDTPQSAVAGQTTIPGIVNVFANRLAQLPASVVNRTFTPSSTA